jgi:hypothetical protein
MVIDVESMGLYGEGFAVATVIYDRLNKEFLEKRLIVCPHDTATNGHYTKSDYEWIEANVIPYLVEDDDRIDLDSPREVRDTWYHHYQMDKLYCGPENISITDNLSVWADCGYPVESNFLRQVAIENLRDRSWLMPYPLNEIATVRALVGLHPTASYDLPKEQQHNPLSECNYIAVKLAEWLDTLAPLTM